MKIITLKKKKHVFGDLSIFGKIAATGPYRRGDFLVDFEYFLKCLKYPSNFSETFKILLFHENNHFEEKKACFGEISIFEEKKYFGDTSIGTKIAISVPYRRGHFFAWFWIFFDMLKIPFQFFRNIQNFFLSWKHIGFMKKKHVLGIFQFSAKSLYLDHTGVAISLVDFLYFLKCWKHPSNSSRNIQNLVLSWEQSLWRKKSMFWVLFNFRTKIDVSGHYRHGHFLVDFEYFL